MGGNIILAILFIPNKLTRMIHSPRGRSSCWALTRLVGCSLLWMLQYPQLLSQTASKPPLSSHSVPCSEDPCPLCTQMPSGAEAWRAPPSMRFRSFTPDAETPEKLALRSPAPSEAVVSKPSDHRRRKLGASLALHSLLLLPCCPAGQPLGAAQQSSCGRDQTPARDGYSPLKGRCLCGPPLAMLYLDPL